MIKLLPFIFVILWSSAFITTKPITDHSDPFAALAFRFLIVSLGFFIFSIYKKQKIIIKKKCDYEVHVLRQPKKISSYNEEKIVKIFEPRYQFKKISLVFSHINPLIVIVKK